MWSNIRSTQVPVTKGESTAKVRRFAEICNSIGADNESLTSLNENMPRQTFNYTVIGVTGWDIGNKIF